MAELEAPGGASVALGTILGIGCDGDGVAASCLFHDFVLLDWACDESLDLTLSEVSPSLCLYYSTNVVVCQEVFEKNFKKHQEV